jgi:hypothetical protein
MHLLHYRLAVGASAGPARKRIRLLHYGRRTEEAYLHWVRSFIRFHGNRHPALMERRRSRPSWDGWRASASWPLRAIVWRCLRRWTTGSTGCRAPAQV